MKKLALLLTLCLAVTMLPGIGYTEDEFAPNGLDMPIADQPSGDDLLLELPEEDVEEVPIDDDLSIDLEASGEAIEISDEIGELQFTDDEQDAPSAENAGEATQPEAPTDGETNEQEPHADPDGPKLDTDRMTLGIDDFRYLISANKRGDGVTYISSDSGIAKVYKSGRVTGVSEGFAIITAVGDNGASSECFVYVKKAPVEVSFGVNSLTLAKGEYFKGLQVILGDPAEEYGGTYTLTSENKNVVKVKSNNVLKGVKPGKTRIKVETYNGLKGTLEVTVKKAPDKVTLSVDRPVLGVGEKGKVSYKLPKNTSGSVTFSSSSPEIVSVNSDTGEILALAEGEAEILGTTFNGVEGAVTVTVAPAPESVSFESDSIKLGIGMKLKVAAVLNDGAAGAITYSVSDKKKVELADGVITGLKTGKTVLKAKTYNKKTAKCVVEVVEAPTEVRLPWKELDIGVDESRRLEPDVGSSASTFTYSSNNTKVVKVDREGTVTGVRKGTATITVKTYNDKKFKLKVHVIKNPDSVTLSPDSLELSVGESSALTWTFPKGTSAGVAFESSDPTVAEVDPRTGVVTGISAGKATITVTTSNGKTDQTEVTVLPAPEWIKFTEDYVEIGAAQTHRLTVEMNPGSAAVLAFSSSDEKVATVSEDGTVTGVAAGEATVAVTTAIEGIAAQMTVKVLPAPRKVKFKPSEMTLNVGDTVLLMPVITKGSATGFTYLSSAPEVAAVAEDGALTALSKGEATVTVTTSNNLTANLKVTVEDPYYPLSAELTNAPSSMKSGETLQLEWKVTPSEAEVDFAWESSNADIAYVDEGGVLHAVDMGYATITATSRRNPEIVLNFRVVVETDDVTLTIPARITGTGGIKTNLALIDNIRQSAIKQIEALKANGKITSDDASKRKRIINNAFGDNAFPWMTLKKQIYWEDGYAQGGAKDFKPKQVYYGVPYTQDHRGYNVALLLERKYYYDSGKDYYILDQSKFKNDGRDGGYRGSDCSSFVSTAIWGTGADHSHDKTKDIASSSAYKTVKDYGDLRTGDLICKSKVHVVMFLYFVNAEKTKMMITENGGNEHGSNTVHCIIRNVSDYRSQGYKVRRLKSLG